VEKYHEHREDVTVKNQYGGNMGENEDPESIKRIWIAVLDEALMSARGEALIPRDDYSKPSYQIASHFFSSPEHRLSRTPPRVALCLAIQPHIRLFLLEKCRIEALEWFLSSSREEHSFLWVCKSLGIDPARPLRRILHMWGVNPEEYGERS
jgi:hypothetical protein